VRIGQQQFGVPFVERSHLFGPTKADEVLLETESGLGTHPLLFDDYRHPIFLAQTGDDLGCGDKRVACAQAVHRAGGEDATGLTPQFIIGERLGFEVCRCSIQDHGSLLAAGRVRWLRLW
jgi:hypothetical protein